MTVRSIVRYGAPSLVAAAAPVLEVDDHVRALIDDMVATMHAAPGIGLAAPQVGVPLRVCVIDLSVGARPSELVTLVNPTFVARAGMQLEEEGCLSLPGFTATVARPETCVVAALDRLGQPVQVEGTGLLARALQHELDHLDGRLFVDRLPAIRRWQILRRVARLRRRRSWT